MLFFAASAGFVIRNNIKMRSVLASLKDAFDFSFRFELGFWVYLIGAIFMVLAIILKFIDRS